MKLFQALLLKGFFISTVLICANSYSQEFPIQFKEIEYASIGSCETNNLSFNAARFSKIPTHEVRDGLEVYLQIILFLHPDQNASIRVMKQGLIGCNEKVCSYKPFLDTKKIFHASWNWLDEKMNIPMLGTIEKIRDDFPWLGFKLKTNNDFLIDEARNLEVIGGKIQINFNLLDVNVVTICK